MPDRPAFDPARVRSPKPPDSLFRTGPALLRVRQVNELVRSALASQVPATLHVIGEVGNLSRPSSGHLYFSLKDADSELACVLWRSQAVGLRFQLEPGLEVIATGSLDVYTQRGAYQLYVRKLEPRGAGALDLAFRQLRERLGREGLFAAERKKALPALPLRIGVVTSPSGAALRDIVQTLRRRFPPLEILVFPVRVQGEGAAIEIAAMLRWMNRAAADLGGIDAAILARGGGSLEDLWAFNEEVVARALGDSAIPVVCGVGHEIDTTIADLVADVRAPTPTAAAELIAPALGDVTATLQQRCTAAQRAACRVLELANARQRAARGSAALARPLTLLQGRQQRLDEAQHRLREALLHQASDARRRLNRAENVIWRFRAGSHFRRLSARVARSLERLSRAASRLATRGERQLALRGAQLATAGPRPRLMQARERLSTTQVRAARALRFLVAQRRQALAARLETLSAYDPQGVLRRGYSITRAGRTGRILRSRAQVRAGMRIRTQLADGEFGATADDPFQGRLFE